MSSFQSALTAFLSADPAHPFRTIAIAVLVGALASAILHLVYRRKDLGAAKWMVMGFAGMLMLIGGINCILGIKALLA